MLSLKMINHRGVSNTTNVESGYIYVMKNTKQPKLFKVGRSKEPERRASELSKPTGVLGEYRVVYKKRFKNYKRAEKSIHKELKKRGYHYEKEFFKGPLKGIKRTILEEAAEERQQSHLHYCLLLFFMSFILYLITSIPYYIMVP